MPLMMGKVIDRVIAVPQRDDAEDDVPGPTRLTYHKIVKVRRK